MLDQSVNDKSIAFAISAKERYKYPAEFIASDEKVIEKCINFYFDKKDFPNLVRNQVYSNSIYQIDDVVSEVLLRRLNLTLKTINQAKQQNRNNIIKAIKALIHERKPYSLLRLDIKHFYESIDTAVLIDKVSKDSAYSLTTRDLLNKWISCFVASGAKGLPRGLNLSATLAEYYMAPFDKSAKRIDGVFYYARFVDDIIIFTTDSPQNVVNNVQKILPSGLKLNCKKNKQQIISIPAYNHKEKGSRADFEYLGYKFMIDDYKEGRKISIDMSDSKRNKITTRITKAFRDYESKKDFQLLEKRIRFLTSNYYLFNKYRSTTVRSGIYYNYVYATDYIDSKSNFHKLDTILRNILFSGQTSKKLVGKTLTLSTIEKRKLSRLSFVKGHKKKLFHRFTPLQMKHIKTCWSF